MHSKFNMVCMIKIWSFNSSQLAVCQLARKTRIGRTDKKRQSSQISPLSKKYFLRSDHNYSQINMILPLQFEPLPLAISKSCFLLRRAGMTSLSCHKSLTPGPLYTINAVTSSLSWTHIKFKFSNNLKVHINIKNT